MSRRTPDALSAPAKPAQEAPERALALAGGAASSAVPHHTIRPSDRRAHAAVGSLRLMFSPRVGPAAPSPA